MNEIERIFNRVNKGMYVMSCHISRESLYTQMSEDVVALKKHIEQLEMANDAKQSTDNCNMHVVNNRRELLIAFIDWMELHSDNTVDRGWIDDYLRTN